MFRNREDAALQLAQALKARKYIDPLVLAIPRGGVVTGTVLARELGAELDVVLARKLRAPGRPELAIGAIAEGGRVHLNHHVQEFTGDIGDYLVEELHHQRTEIARRQRIFRSVRPQAPVAGRSVIVTDDGTATGSTMLAALKAVRAQKPHDLLVAVPVAPPGRLKEVGRWCDDVVCLLEPDDFWAVGQFYEDFAPVEDGQVVDLLRAFGKRSAKAVPKTVPAARAAAPRG
jgi:predicted phosphoribosyltransferase